MIKKIILFTLITASLHGDGYLSGVFIQPVKREFDMSIEANNNEYVVEEVLVEDVRRIMSGMIYGWKFKYVPSNKKREIKEIFTLNPIASLKKGDPSMDFREDWVKDNIMYVNVSYKLYKFQEKRLKNWNSDIIPVSTGEGFAPLFDEDGKFEALKVAMKDAIKNLYVSRGKPRPRNIEGEILLMENPRVFIDSGAWNVRIKVKLKIKESESYQYH